jgi:hypothetical protein
MSRRRSSGSGRSAPSPASRRLERGEEEDAERLDEAGAGTRGRGGGALQVEGWVPAAGRVALGFAGAVLIWVIASAAVPGFALPFEREEEGVESARSAC